MLPRFAAEEEAGMGICLVFLPINGGGRNISNADTVPPKSRDLQVTTHPPQSQDRHVCLMDNLADA